MKVKELLSDKSKWTMFVSARDKGNTPITPDSPEAAKWCLIGAVQKCYPENERSNILTKLREEIITYTKNRIDFIDKFNDYETTTFEDIRQVLERCDI